MSGRFLDNNSLLRREQELIDAALSIMEEEGTTALTMDKLVARVPYSKGTVYNLFCSKEDLLIGICNAGMRWLKELFDRAAAFEGSSRERILAIHSAYLLHALLNPGQFMQVISAKTPNLIERTSEARMEEHSRLEGLLTKIMLEQVDAATAAGELDLPFPLTREQVVFACWATGFGAIALLIYQDCQQGARRDLDVTREARNNLQLLLDGMHWRPLSNEWDYESTLNRIAGELFSEEMARLEAVRGRRVSYTPGEKQAEA